MAAVNTGSGNLYLIVSVLLGCLAVSGVLGRKNLLGLEVRLDFPDEIHDGQEIAVRLRLDNIRRFPAFLLQVELADAKILIPVLSPGEKHAATALLRFSGRGIHHLGTLRIRSLFPVHFFLRWREIPVDRQVVAFPAPRACVPIRLCETAASGEFFNSQRGHEGEISRIGDYRGEPLRLIHWKLSARQEDLKIKELSAGTGEAIILDPDRLPGGGLEERLQHGAFLIGHFLRLNIPTGLKVGKRIIPPASSRSHRIRLLTELALYGSP